VLFELIFICKQRSLAPPAAAAGYGGYVGGGGDDSWEVYF
jgi:hypothetical protein